MAAGRPRLVAEGSPIVDDDGSMSHDIIEGEEGAEKSGDSMRRSSSGMNGSSSSLFAALANEGSDDEADGDHSSSSYNNNNPNPRYLGKNYNPNYRPGGNKHKPSSTTSYAPKQRGSYNSYHHQKKTYPPHMKQSSLMSKAQSEGQLSVIERQRQKQGLPLPPSNTYSNSHHGSYTSNGNGNYNGPSTILPPMIKKGNGATTYPVANNGKIVIGGAKNNNVGGIGDDDDDMNGNNGMVEKMKHLSPYTANHHYEIGGGSAPRTPTLEQDPAAAVAMATTYNESNGSPTTTTSKSPYTKNHHYQIGAAPPSPGGSTPMKDAMNGHASASSHMSYTDTADHSENNTAAGSVERMVGIEDHSVKAPLVVLDGANVAYAYAQTKQSTTMDPASFISSKNKPEPDAKGIQVACEYFTKAGIRILVVLPSPWLESKPNNCDENRSNSKMVTPHLEILNDYKKQGLLVASPPKDDDDAYAITIARRESNNNNSGQQTDRCGYVLSNDMFRDAMARDETGSLTEWLKEGKSKEIGPGRISFAFCDMGSIDTYGDSVLDIIPNPRHPLIAHIENK